MSKRRNKLIVDIKACLTNNLRLAKYQNSHHKLAGHCYVASEAFYHMDVSEHWKPMFLYHEDEPHWFLKHRLTGEIVDITASQFTTKPSYDDAKGKGFLTKDPSRRCRVLLTKILARRKFQRQRT